MKQGRFHHQNSKAPRAFLALVLFFATLIGHAEEAETVVLCKFDKTVRTLRIHKASDKCETVYTKQGVDQVIGSGQNPDSCRDILANVRKNLEEAKWSCREIQNSQVHDLSQGVRQ